METESNVTNALYERERALGARFGERAGRSVPLDYGDVHAEYAALREQAGLIDLSHFGVLQVRGGDRVAWLHNLTTANVQSLGEGQGVYALLLNAKGHVVADFNLLVRGEQEGVLLYTSQSAKIKLMENLRRGIFREKVVLEDAGDSLAVLSLQGPQASEVLAKWLGPVPALAPFQSIQMDQVLVVRNTRAEAEGFDLLSSPETALSAWDSLVEQRARPVGLDALNTARVEAGIPWYGDDFDETMLAPEARLDPFIADSKGCYTGQEVIARIKNRGHVNRLLVRVQVHGEAMPARGDDIFVQDQQAGWITGSVYSFARRAPLAFGYLRREFATADLWVQIVHGQSRLDAVVVP